MVTVTDVLDLIAAVLHLQGGRPALAAAWSELAEDGLEDGQADIFSVLALRGLTGAQIASWTGFDSFVRRQAAYWALCYGGSMLPTPLNQQEIEALDQREALKTLTLLDGNGNLILPLFSVGHGVIRGGFADVAARDPRRRMGFINPGTGSIRPW